MNMTEEIPDQKRMDEMRYAVMDALGSMIAEKRKDAMEARANSGIEEEWDRAEEFYQGIDDANRHESMAGVREKPLAGGSTARKSKYKGSTVFPNVTQPYCDAASARVGDMLLPTDDRNFICRSEPIPEMPEQAGELVAQVVQGQPAAQPPNIDVMKREADAKAKKAQTRIDDWLSECQYHAELRKLFDDCAKLGTGVIKGPVPVKRTSKAWQKDDQGNSVLIVKEEIKPASFRVSVDNLFPDWPACGDNIHNGSFIFERDYLSESKLEDLIGVDGYDERQINLCIDEGPFRYTATGKIDARASAKKKSQYEAWYFYGRIKSDELVACGYQCEDGEELPKSVHAIVTMVNDRVIRAKLNPLETGEFPYDMVPWKRRPDMPWGVGVAQQGRTPQRMIVAATRNLMNNAGLAGGPMFVMRKGAFSAMDNTPDIAPLKKWLMNDDVGTQSVKDAFQIITIPMLQRELTEIIQLGMKMMEDVTGLPQLLQGQQGNAPDTVGGMTIVNNNATSVLRRIARLFDSCITEPHIKRYYAWMMEYGEDEDEKGAFMIEARGSSALVERDVQNHTLPQIAQMALNPAFGWNPKKASSEFLKSLRFDPSAFEYTEEEQKQMAEQKAPVDPRIEAAIINAQSRKEIVQMTEKVKAVNAQADREFEATENEKDRNTKIMVQMVDEQLAGQELSSQERQVLEKIKADLAKAAASLNLQRELTTMGHRKDLTKHYTPQVATPKVEPIGKAPPGEAFQA